MPQPPAFITPEERRCGPAECVPADFPGCEPFRLPGSGIERYGGRLDRLRNGSSIPLDLARGVTPSMGARLSPRLVA